MATSVLGLKTFAAADPVDYNEINDNYNKIDNGVKTAFHGRAAHNLLDNSDFRNPVNQRGQSSYNGITYTIDRWRSWDSNNITTLNDGSISVSVHIVQNIPKNRFKNGSSYTIALCALDGTLYVNSGVYTPDAEDFGDWTHTWVEITDSGDVAIYLRNGTYAWAALYEGSYTANTLPAYQPKGYAAELAECQRYYYQSWTGSIGANGIITRQAMALSRLASVELPCTMRTTPTITLYTSNGQAGAVKGWLDSVVVSGMTVVYANSKSFIPAHEGNGLTIGNWYGFHYTASADL